MARLVDNLHTLSLSDQGALSYYREPVEPDRDVVHSVYGVGYTYEW